MVRAELQAGSTFLGYQTLAACGQSHHDDAYARVFSLHTNPVSLPARFHKVSRGNGAHVGREDAIGPRHDGWGVVLVYCRQGVQRKRRRGVVQCASGRAAVWDRNTGQGSSGELESLDGGWRVS